MIVRTRDDLVEGKGKIRSKYWSSQRLLHEEDGMG